MTPQIWVHVLKYTIQWWKSSLKITSALPDNLKQFMLNNSGCCSEGVLAVIPVFSFSEQTQTADEATARCSSLINRLQFARTSKQHCEIVPTSPSHQSLSWGKKSFNIERKCTKTLTEQADVICAAWWHGYVVKKLKSMWQPASLNTQSFYGRVRFQEKYVNKSYKQNISCFQKHSRSIYIKGPERHCDQ